MGVKFTGVMNFKRRPDLLVAALVFLSLFLYVYGPIYLFKMKADKVIGEKFEFLIGEFGNPDFNVTAKQIQMNKSGWPWWGENFSPKPLKEVTHEAYGYLIRGFVIFWFYTDEFGNITYVARVET